MAQQPKYQGKEIRSQRDARQGDQGFQQGQDQVVVTLDNGEEKTVKRTELTGQTQQPGQGQGGQQR